MKLKKLFITFMCLLITFGNLAPLTEVKANQTTLHGVPVDYYQRVESAKSNLDAILTESNQYKDLVGYQLRVAKDLLWFKYQIAILYEKLGNHNPEGVLDTYILYYNNNIRDEYLNSYIEAETYENGNFIVKELKQDDVRKEAIKLITFVKGSTDEKNPEYFNFNFIAEILKHHKEVGLPTGYEEKYGLQSTAPSQEDIEKYLKNNIKDIRNILTATKELLTDQKDMILEGNTTDLNTVFVKAYESIINFAIELDIEELKNLDLFGENSKPIFDKDAETSYTDLGEWEENDEGDITTLKSFSENFLINFAASATFRPFETNMNNLETYSFLSDSAKNFHSTYGTKRKMLFSVVESKANYGNTTKLDVGAPMKYITLKNLMENEDGPMGIYVDGLSYDLDDIVETQLLVDTEYKDLEDSEKDEIIKNTTREESAGWFKKWWEGLFLGSNKEQMKELVFAYGPEAQNSDSSELNKDLRDSQLIINNIREQYWTFYKENVEFRNDLNKPLYLDIYGNILTASGYVVIPSVNNPWYFDADKADFSIFNKTFLESYPKIVAKKGKPVLENKDKDKMYYTYSEVKEKDTSENNTTEYRVEVQPSVIENGDKYSDKARTYSNRLLFNVSKFDSAYDKVMSFKAFKFFSNNEGTLSNDYSLIEEISKSKDKDKEIDKDLQVLVINETTMSVAVEGEVVEISFTNFPDLDEVNQYIYITELTNLIEVKDNKINDLLIHSSNLRNIVSEVYLNGTYDIETINDLVPTFIKTIFQELKDFFLEMTNGRYEGILADDKPNNILYAQPLDEMALMTGILPLIYKFMLILAISLIILNIIVAVVKPQSKMKLVIKIFAIMYLITYFISGVGWVFEQTINKPTKTIMQKNLAYWTVLQQEKEMSKIKIVNEEEEEAKTFIPTEGYKIRLQKTDLTYPFKLLTRPTMNSANDIGDYYEQFLTDDNLYSFQNNKMYVDGSYLVTNTKEVFDSSYILVDTEASNIRKPLVHEVYDNPELAYYMPYYMILDSLVYKINTYTELSKYSPYDIYYPDKTIKTTGRVNSWLSSKVFLDYDGFLDYMDRYISQADELGEEDDDISQQLAVDTIKEELVRYGDDSDFLGLSKMFEYMDTYNQEPFGNLDEANLRLTAWYPKFDLTEIREQDIEEMKEIFEDIGMKTKRFMLNLYDVSAEVSDEHILKTTALYASMEYNKAMSKFTGYKYARALEVDNVSIEELMMALALPYDKLIDNTINGYPNYVLNTIGFEGLFMISINDILIVIINFLKPMVTLFMMLVAMIAIFIKKIVVPDDGNKSIWGSMKSLLMFAILSMSFNIILSLVMTFSLTEEYLFFKLLIIMVACLLYIVGMLYLVWLLLDDVWNSGNALMFKGLDNAVSTAKKSLEGITEGIPLLSKVGVTFEGSKSYLNSLDEKLESKSRGHANAIEKYSMSRPLTSLFKTKGVGGSDSNSASSISSNPNDIDNSAPKEEVRRGLFERKGMSADEASNFIQREKEKYGMGGSSNSRVGTSGRESNNSLNSSLQSANSQSTRQIKYTETQEKGQSKRGNQETYVEGGNATSGVGMSRRPINQVDKGSKANANSFNRNSNADGTDRHRSKKNNTLNGTRLK